MMEERRREPRSAVEKEGWPTPPWRVRWAKSRARKRPGGEGEGEGSSEIRGRRTRSGRRWSIREVSTSQAWPTDLRGPEQREAIASEASSQ
jgi:hypothetical protein